MPFLAGVMALVSRVLSVRATAIAVTALSVIAWVGAAGIMLRRIRPSVDPLWWWVTAFGLATFAPLMSTVWWKQFNVIALVLAAGGFELARRRRSGFAGAAIGLSIALKPMVILLPFALLVSRASRRAGALAIAWVVGLNVAAQALMAARAHSLATLDPFTGLRNFLNKAKPNLFSCLPVNFSPGSLLCRQVHGIEYWTLQRIVVWIFLFLLAAWVFDSLRGRGGLSWASFAFICALSAMTSPFEWTHYQVMLAPLFVLLFFNFSREGAGPGAWAGLAVALVLASMLWEPYGTLFGTVRHILTGTREIHKAIISPREERFQEGIAQFAQYILVITGALWYSSRRVAVSRSP